MTAIDAIRQWFRREKAEIEFYDVEMLAKGMYELDERLSELFDQVQVTQARIAKHEYEEHGIDAERHKPQITVTDAMILAGQEYAKQRKPEGMAYRHITPFVPTARWCEGFFKAMWEARDDNR